MLLLLLQCFAQKDFPYQLFSTNDSVNSQPAISILMNCFNGSEYLKIAIESVIAQTFHRWELIFWDNRSTDNSAKIVEGFTDPRIRYFLADRHTTLGDARELARKKAIGEWIAVLDVDDYWLKNNLEAKIRMEVRPDVGLIYSRFLLDRTAIEENSFVSPKQKIMDEGNIYLKLVESNFIGLPTVLYRNRAISGVGGFGRLPLASDYDMNLRISKQWEVLAVDEVTAVYRVHRNSLSLAKPQEIFLERERLIREMPEEIRQRVWASIFVDRLSNGKLETKEIIKWLRRISIRHVGNNILIRIIRCIKYRTSAVRKAHKELVWRLTNEW